MTDFLTRLRDEVVDADARYGERHRAGRAVPRRQPGRRAFVLGALVTVCSLAVLVLAIASLGPPSREGAPARVVARVPVGGQPIDAAVLDGTVWIADFDGRIVRIDSRRRRITGETRLAGDAREIATDDGAIWVSVSDMRGAADYDSSFALRRIDPSSGRIVGGFRATQHRAAVAAGSGWLWAAPGHAPGTVARIDPATGRPTARVAILGGSTVEAAGGSAWVLANNGTVLEIDAASGRVASRLLGVAPSAGIASLTGSIVADERGAWVVAGDRDELLRIEGGRVVRQLGVPDLAPPVAAAGGSLWLTASDPVRRRNALVRVDAVTGRQTARIPLGSAVPSALAVVDEGVWVVTTDGMALRVEG